MSLAYIFYGSNVMNLLFKAIALIKCEITHYKV